MYSGLYIKVKKAQKQTETKENTTKVNINKLKAMRSILTENEKTTKKAR